MRITLRGIVNHRLFAVRILVSVLIIYTVLLGAIPIVITEMIKEGIYLMRDVIEELNEFIEYNPKGAE